MAITLGGVALPDGLRWADEFAWSPRVQSTEWSITGALLVQEGEKQAGRPITLIGGRTWAWMTRVALLALQSQLDNAPGTGLTLVLHDSRSFQVIPRMDESGAIQASPLPRIGDSGFADPSDDDWYYIDELRLLEI